MVYTFVIRSENRISGDVNNGVYDVDFHLLPQDVKYYNLHYVFYTQPGFYFDHIDAGNSIVNLCANGWIETNLVFYKSMETRPQKCSSSHILGNWTRNVQDCKVGGSGIPAISFLESTNGMTNVPRTILRPSENILNISVYNGYDGDLMCETTSTGSLYADMSDFILTINLEPVYDEL